MCAAFSSASPLGVLLLGGGDGFGHVVQRDLVHVAGGVEVALAVVEGAVRFFTFGVCAIPQFTHVLCVTVDVVQEGFETVQVFGGSVVIFANILVPFVGDEVGAGAAHADGDGHGVVVADIGGEVGTLLVRESVPRVGERLLRAGGVFVACRGVAIFVGEGQLGVGVPFLFLFAHPREGACLSFCVVWSVRFYCGWFSCWRSG